MALDKDILGTALYNAFDEFNNKTPAEVGNIETARLNFCKVMAHEIIEHIKANAIITLDPIGLTAGVNPVIGSAQSTIV